MILTTKFMSTDSISHIRGILGPGHDLKDETFCIKAFFDLRKVLAPENLRLEPENHPIEIFQTSFFGEKVIF